MSRGVDLIAAERARQVLDTATGGEGYTAEHDRGHAEDLAAAGASYALPPGERQLHKLDGAPAAWPWEPYWYKPVPGDRIAELTKAGALIAAAIDSLTEQEAALDATT